MDVATLRARTSQLVTSCDQGPADDEAITQLTQGTITLLRAVHGAQSAQEKDLDLRVKMAYSDLRPDLVRLRLTVRGVLRNLLGEIDAGVLGSVRAQTTGEVIADFVALAQSTLTDPSDGAKNVAAVLSAAAFEDLLRRLSEKHSLPHHEKLADTHIALKDAGILKGAQIATSQSFLTFRNKALHAEWTLVDRAVVQSCLAFTEQMVTAHFV